MRKRVTQKMLENKANFLNSIMERPLTPYTETIEDGKKRYKANIGNYHISYAYGGACLHETATEGGGVNCPVGNHHRPKRELLEAMDNFMQGIGAVGRDHDLFRR